MHEGVVRYGTDRGNLNHYYQVGSTDAHGTDDGATSAVQHFTTH